MRHQRTATNHVEAEFTTRGNAETLFGTCSTLTAQRVPLQPLASGRERDQKSRFRLRLPPAPPRPTRRQISNQECLRSLTLDFWGIATPTVFDYITCPNLTHFRFTSMSSCRKEDWNSDATSHFSNQIRNVSRLSFIFPNFSSALRSILQSCSASLEVLDLDHNVWDSSKKICARHCGQLSIPSSAVL